MEKIRLSDGGFTSDSKQDIENNFGIQSKN